MKALSVAQALLWAKEPLRARQRLEAYDGAALDAEILLAFAIAKNRTWLKTWPEYLLSEDQKSCFEDFISRRREG